MKRLACLLLALGMIFSLCACGKEEIKKEEIKAEDLIGTYVSSHETLYLRSDGTYGECQFNRDQFSSLLLLITLLLRFLQCLFDTTF